MNMKDIEKGDVYPQEKIIHSAEQIVESFSLCTRNAFVTCDPEGNITYFSKRMEDITGWHESEMFGNHVSKLYALPKTMEDVIDQPNAKPQPAVLYKRDGKKVTFPARQTSIRNINNPNKIDGYLTLFITNMGDVDRAHAEFTSTVSHELRTPITSIKGFASTLLDHRSKIDEEKKKRYLKIIQEQANRLSRLVEDLLAVSRLESQRLKISTQHTEIRHLIEKAATIAESKYKGSHEININSEGNPRAWADPDRVEQIFTNLIENAIKYSPEANKVDVYVKKALLNRVDMVQVDVVDYGVGIAEADFERIFSKFGRLDTPLTRSTEGTGLGLYITKSLANIMKGDLKVSSKEGKTVFSVYLPATNLEDE